MTKRQFYITVGSAIVAVLVYIFFIRDARENRLMIEGEKLADRVEAFRKETGRLPDNVVETGVEETESGPLYYQKQDSTHYIIWFGTSLGESEIYYSGSKAWGHADRAGR